MRIGLQGAVDDLCKKMNIDSLEYDEMLATSSAAGGLKMTVHGLVYDMTAKAAKEAALGAGGIIHYITAGKLRRTDLAKIKEIKPNLILIAGGVDYGERDTALDNAEKIRALGLNTPIIYAGNIENQEEMKLIFDEESGQKLYNVENVYPKIDDLNVEPCRKVIQDAFEEHIIHAPGMEHVRDMVNGPIIPTPGAVMECTKLLYDCLGDLIVLDVGGATTDLHSVATESDKIARIMIAPEPKAKRTVEGDLGVYVNRMKVIESIGEEQMNKDCEKMGIDLDETSGKLCGDTENRGGIQAGRTTDERSSAQSGGTACGHHPIYLRTVWPKHSSRRQRSDAGEIHRGNGRRVDQTAASSRIDGGDREAQRNRHDAVPDRARPDSGRQRLHHGLPGRIVEEIQRSSHKTSGKEPGLPVPGKKEQRLRPS